MPPPAEGGGNGCGPSCFDEEYHRTCIEYRRAITMIATVDAIAVISVIARTVAGPWQCRGSAVAGLSQCCGSVAAVRLWQSSGRCVAGVLQRCGRAVVWQMAGPYQGCRSAEAMQN